MLPRLLLLVLIAVLPALGIQFYNQLQLTAERTAEVRREALTLAGDLSARYAFVLDSVRRTLALVAGIFAREESGNAACAELLDRARAALAGLSGLASYDAAGQQVCASSAGTPGPPRLSEGSAVLLALTEGRVGLIHEIASDGEPGVLTFVEPVRRADGAPDGAILAWYPVGRLDPAAGGQLPAGRRLLLADRDGKILRAEGLGHGIAAGQPLPPIFAAIAIGSDRAGSVSIREEGGEDIAYGILPRAAAPADLFIAVGVPTAPALQGIAETTRRALLLIGAGLIVALAVAWLGGRRIVQRPLDELAEAARQLSQGRWSGIVSARSGPPELRRMASAFGDMATALQQQTAALTASEQAARLLRSQLVDAIESIPDGFVLYDSDDRLVISNDRDRQLFPALAPAMVPGTARRTIIMAASAAGYRPVEFASDEEFLASTIEAKPETGREYERRLADGRWIHFREFRTSDGGLVSLRSDQTESRRRDEQLRQAQKMEAIGQLTGGIAHDFNNLLTVILGNAELLAEELAAGPAELRQLAEMSRSAAERGAELTRRLLYFARNQALSPSTVDVNVLLRAMEPLLVRTLGGNIVITLMLGPDLWPAECDSTQLETAILNLAVNARDAMPDGGHLGIRTENTTLAQATAGDLRPGDYVRISVSDTGLGMPPETMQRAFEPFYTTKEAGKGSGLGLSMVYGFARQSRGQVQIDSALGLGTTLVLLLPRASLLPEAERTRAREKAVGGKETILVVEDNGSVREFVTAQLRSLGYRIMTATSAAEALRILEQEPAIDLLFSDIMMPGGMNGRQLALEARRIRPALRILLTTGFADSSADPSLAPDLPVLQKPYLKHVLARRIREVLDR